MIHKKLKYLVICFIFNVVMFTSFLWCYYYAQHIGHWSANPLLIMLSSSGIVKVFLLLGIVDIFGNLREEKDA